MNFDDILNFGYNINYKKGIYYIKFYSLFLKE